MRPLGRCGKAASLFLCWKWGLPTHDVRGTVGTCKALTRPVLRVTRTGDLQHGSNRFDDELIQTDANSLTLGKRHEELVR